MKSPEKGKRDGAWGMRGMPFPPCPLPHPPCLLYRFAAASEDVAVPHCCIAAWITGSICPTTG